jgi:carnitine 3-dehydrogenase
MGPNLLWHLGRGEGGIQHFMETLMPQMAASWPSLGVPELTPELEERIVTGVLTEAKGQPIDTLAARRDAMLFGLLAVRAKEGG